MPPHERNRWRLAFPFSNQAEEDHLRTVLDLAVDFDDLSDNRVPGIARRETTPQPSSEVLSFLVRLLAAVGIGRQLGRTNPVSPGATELLAELRRCKEFVDQLRSLVRLGAVEKRGRLRSCRDSAGQIDRNAPQELRVITERSRFQLGLGQRGLQMPVDRRGDLLRLMPFMRRQQRVRVLPPLSHRWHPGGDPTFENGLLRCGQFLFPLGHLIGRDPFPDQAGVQIARLDRGSRFAPFNIEGIVRRSSPPFCRSPP